MFWRNAAVPQFAFEADKPIDPSDVPALKAKVAAASCHRMPGVCSTNFYLRHLAIRASPPRSRYNL
jgi:hypothetical protein